MAIVSAGFWAARWGILPMESGFFLILAGLFSGFLGVASIFKSLQSGTLAVRLLRKGIFTRGSLVEVEYADARSGVKRVKAFRKISSEYREIWRTENMTDEELHAAMEQAMQDGRTLLPQATILNYYVKFRAGNGGDYFVRGATDSRSGARVEDEESEPVLYLEKNPDKAVILDAIFHLPEIWPDGSLAPLPLKKAVHLILPFGVVIGNVVCWYWYTGG